MKITTIFVKPVFILHLTHYPNPIGTMLYTGNKAEIKNRPYFPGAYNLVSKK